MRAFGPSATGTTLLGALVLSLAAAFALVEVGPAAGIALGALPLAVIAAAALLTWGRVALLAAALALPLSGLTFLSQPLPIPGPSIFPQDVIIVLALGSWAVAALAARASGEIVPPVPRTPVLGWPFVVFGAAIVIATMRGHYSYGASLFGQPLRLVIYAGIVVTLAGVTAGGLYRLLLWLFYTGTAVTTLVALYYIASGTSQTDQLALSTGGSRILGISTTLYCAGALFLALLSLRVTPAGGERVLHLVVAVLATFCVAVGFGRAVYGAVAVVCVVLVLASRAIRHSILWVLPLALPFVILLALFVPVAAPELVDSVEQRMFSAPADDANVQWRIEANRAVFAQIREAPIFGVGFGRSSFFFVNVENSNGLPVPVRQEILQDPHNGYLLLWAGGGLVTLGAFVLLLAVFAGDAIRRFRSNPDPIARLIVVWSAVLLFAFLVNAASGTMFEAPGDLLTIWALLVLPAVALRGERPPSGSPAPAPAA